jgi:hypothetical protein
MELFQVGGHVVKVTSAQGRWAVMVDETPLERWYTCRADAWTAGVREVDRLEAQGPAPAGGEPPRVG